jgi:hypothetical protein
MGKVKGGANFALGLLVLAASIFFAVPATAKPDGAKDMEPGMWTGAGGHRRLKFGEHIWRVLHVYSYEGQKRALLLAEAPVAVRKFDSNDNDWRASDIKKWLNEDFYNGAFSESERDAILTAHYRHGGPNDGSDKTDSSKIFLLSIDEALNDDYFADDDDRAASTSWWLRSPGLYLYRAALVYSHGYIFDNGNVSDVYRSYAVRPALIANLSSPLFTSSSSRYETLYEPHD